MFVEYADAKGFSPLDIHKANKKSSVLAAEFTQDTSLSSSPTNFEKWLPFAAESYQISKNPKDYVLVPIITIPAGLPNRNGVAFPLSSLIEWAPDHGMQAYRTFVGKPMFEEHANADHTEALGVIVDAALRPMRGFQGNLWKLLKLGAIDRFKNPEIADAVLRNEINSYSMGAYVERYTCSYCGAEMGQCSHIDKRRARDFYLLNGQLVFRNVHGIVGFETSVVRVPAFVSAVSDTLIQL